MMNKWMVAVWVGLVSAGAYAQNQDLNEDYDVEFSQKIQTYYQHPDTKQALNLSKQLMNQPDFDNEIRKQLNTWVWGAQILQQEPKQTNKWCKALKKEKNHFSIAPIFQFANTDAAKRCLKSLKLSDEERELLTQLPDLSAPLERDVQTEVDLDILWSTFFATGNPKALYKIIDFGLDHANKRRNSMDTLRFIAWWSLQSNMSQDAEVKKMVWEYVQSLDASQQKSAKRLLNMTAI